MESPEPKLHNFNLFSDGGIYIAASRLYYAYFKKVPSIKIIRDIDGTRLRKWLETKGSVEIINKHCTQSYDRKEKSLKHTDAFYLLKNGLLINLDAFEVNVLHDCNQDEEAEQLTLQFKQFIRRRRKTQNICMVTNGQTGLDTYPLKLKKPKLVLTKNYNDDLYMLHEKLLSSLKQRDKSGLILFHGLPGTGKSTYIRYLIRCINKKVIFMPPGLAGNLDAPSVANLLIQNANTVFVIEDAEELLISRDTNKNSSISMLLNLTDGLLGETLGIQVIATFNTDLHNIDKALLRKGRLTAIYEFKPLSIEKSRVLLQESGIKDYFVNKPMTLADIYNTENESYQFKTNNRPQIGFLSSTM